ncbi:MAG: helix-turn-helix transcriptional regulator [Cohaesibacteraceae bacterium]
MSNRSHQFLSTKQLPDVTGLSQSFFEKGRIYGFGPPFIRIRTGQRAGKILYRISDVERWLASQEQNPEGADDE